MDQDKHKKLMDLVYNFFIDIFSNGIMNFIQKMFIISISIIVMVILLLFGTWMFFEHRADSYESKHLLKPELKIKDKDTIYVYSLE
jgi:Na+/H+ antiporter NhaD/arsenite permease-like protein